MIVGGVMACIITYNTAGQRPAAWRHEYFNDPSFWFMPFICLLPSLLFPLKYYVLLPVWGVMVWLV